MTIDARDQAERLDRLVLWPEFTGDEWELPTEGVPGERLLVRWKMASESVDGGPPSTVTRLLATVLCRNAELSFPAVLRPPLGASLVPRTWRSGRNFSWSRTSAVDEAVNGIFGGGLFDWSQRGQVVILAAPGAALPLTERELELGSDVRLFGELARAGALGVLLPGVDGEVAGLYLFSAPFAQTVRAGLEEAARAAGAAFVLATADTVPRP